jgi:hypothetical protein
MSSGAVQSTRRIAGTLALLGSMVGVILAEGYPKHEFIQGARIMFGAIGIVVGLTLGFVLGRLMYGRQS